MKDGRHSISYYLQNPGIDGLQIAFTQALGSVKATRNSPKLNRQLPVGSPLMPYFYASSITNIRGIGVPTKVDSTTLPKEAVLVGPFLPQPMPFIAVYPTYELTVEFTPRPYAALADSQIAGDRKITTTWTPPPATGGTAAANIVSVFAQEYFRFVDFDVVPQNDNIEGTQGKFNFRTKTPGSPAVIDKQDFPGMVKLLLPNQILRLKWYEVPYSYYISSNSYLKRFVGYVNQFDWFNLGGVNLFPAGSLLYLGTNPVPYTSPIIQLQKWANGDLDTVKLCTMEMSFLVTNRIAGATEGGPPTPSNTNFIAAGHNLLPFFPRREYHYVVFNSNLADFFQAPPWYSIPFDMLFTNPDYIQNPVIPFAY